MRFYMSQKDQVLNPFTVLSWLQPVDRTGRPTCTDVHASSGRRASRPTRSTVQRALLSGKAPGGRAADRTERLALCILARSTVGTNSLKYDRWPVDRAVDRQAWQTPTASFPYSIKWRIWGLFCWRFSSGFSPVFPELFRGFLHLF